MNFCLRKALLNNVLRFGRKKNISFLGTLSGVHVSDGESRAFSSKKSRETKVLQQIKARIQQTGPIPVADYMKEVLSNPMSGFYMHRDVLGGTGDDVITSAQVSKLFGELVAEWGLHEWKKAGRPKPFYIVELGPNRGDLADDMCRVFSQSPEARELVSLHLVEISPHLSQLQELKLCDTVSVVKDVLEDSDSRRHLHLHSQAASSDERMYKHNITKHGVPVSWYRSFNDLPTGFAFYVSYELFDAYPIHKFKRTPEGWKEVLIDINDGPGEHHLHYVLSRGPTPASRFFVDPQDSREELEVSPESGVLMQDISARLNAHGGVNLVIDYGHEGEKSDTFRAFRKHSLIDPLCEPGTADLTADVDFAYLKNLVKDKCLLYGPITQEQFLAKISVEKRLEKILQSSPKEQHEEIMKGYKMLMDPQGIGGSYKFLSMYPLEMTSTLAKNPPLAFK